MILYRLRLTDRSRIALLIIWSRPPNSAVNPMLAKVKRAEAGCYRLAFQLTRNRGRLVLPRGYTRGLHRLSGRARNPYFTGLSRSCFKVAEREGLEPLLQPLRELFRSLRQHSLKPFIVGSLIVAPSFDDFKLPLFRFSLCPDQDQRKPPYLTIGQVVNDL